MLPPHPRPPRRHERWSLGRYWRDTFMVPGRRWRGYALLGGHHHCVTTARSSPDMRLRHHLGDGRLHDHPLFPRVVSGSRRGWYHRSHHLSGHDQPFLSLLSQWLSIWGLGAGFRRRVARAQRHALQGCEAEHVGRCGYRKGRTKVERRTNQRIQDNKDTRSRSLHLGADPDPLHRSV
jgi:hypothetical protein